MTNSTVKVAYKFTNPGRQAKYGKRDYPPVGEWSDSRTPDLCYSGWHVPVLLSEWIMPELWKVEVKGISDGDKHKVAYEYIRFVEKVNDWNVEAIQDFIVHCCNRPDYAAYEAAYYAAYAAANAAAERAAWRYQHNWIVGRLNLGREMEVPE